MTLQEKKSPVLPGPSSAAFGVCEQPKREVTTLVKFQVLNLRDTKAPEEPRQRAAPGGARAPLPRAPDPPMSPHRERRSRAGRGEGHGGTPEQTAPTTSAAAPAPLPPPPGRSIAINPPDIPCSAPSLLGCPPSRSLPCKNQRVLSGRGPSSSSHRSLLLLGGGSRALSRDTSVSLPGQRPGGSRCGPGGRGTAQAATALLGLVVPGPAGERGRGQGRDRAEPGPLWELRSAVSPRSARPRLVRAGLGVATWRDLATCWWDGRRLPADGCRCRLRALGTHVSAHPRRGRDGALPGDPAWPGHDAGPAPTSPHLPPGSVPVPPVPAVPPGAAAPTPPTGGLFPRPVTMETSRSAPPPRGLGPAQPMGTLRLAHASLWPRPAGGTNGAARGGRAGHGGAVARLSPIAGGQLGSSRPMERLQRGRGSQWGGSTKR